MEKQTILYNILYIDERAKNLIPEVVDAWNITPHRFSKSGESVSLKLNDTIEEIKGYSTSDFVDIEVTRKSIIITLQPNTTQGSRQARITLSIGGREHSAKLLQFVIHQN